MLTIHEDRNHNAIVVEPLSELSREDFAELALRFNHYVNQTDSVPNLVIHASKFPGWDGFGAFLRHLRFVKDHHRSIRKVAIVSDGTGLTILPKLVDHFVSAKVRPFAADRLDDALQWVASDEVEEGGFAIIDDLADDVIAISATGTITSHDYDDILNPLLEAKLKVHDEVKLLFYAGPDFAGYTSGAMWDDARLGMMHLTDFAKVAIVTDVGWLRRGAKFFAPLFPAEVHLFPNDQLDAAKDWIIR